MNPGEAAFDRWSFAHVASGWLLASVGLKPSTAALVLVAYEIFESILRQSPGADGKGLTEYESTMNIAADLACGMAGYFLAKGRF